MLTLGWPNEAWHRSNWPAGWRAAHGWWRACSQSSLHFQAALTLECGWSNALWQGMASVQGRSFAAFHPIIMWSAAGGCRGGLGINQLLLLWRLQVCAGEDSRRACGQRPKQHSAELVCAERGWLLSITALTVTGFHRNATQLAS